MPEDLLDNAFGEAFADPDAFIGLLIGGMQRAQERFNSKLRTVDENGNPFVPDAEQLQEPTP